MTNYLDLKAISYGIVTFIVGYLLLGAVGGLAASSTGNVGAAFWAIVQIVGIVIPVGAGYVSAYFARDRPVFQGIIGGSFGVLPFVGIGAALVPNYPAWGIPTLLVIFAVVAALGAIIGSHVRSKRGP